jgi:hypothetical protein
MFLSTFTDILGATFILFFVWMPLILLWGYALADLFIRRSDIRWRKVLWLLFIIFLPIIGPIVYLLVRPDVPERYPGMGSV